MSALTPEFYQQVANQGLGIKYGLAAGYTAFVYDFATTIDDEIEHIWKRDFSAVSFLFFLDRYYALFSLTLTFSMDIFPAFGPELCQKLIPFQPFGSAIPLTIIPDIVIGLRVYALYGRSALLGLFLAVFLSSELGVALWIYLTPSVYSPVVPGPESITNTMPLHLCMAAASPKLNNLQVASFQFMQTIYDTIVLVLILIRTVKESLGWSFRSLAGIRALIVRHGLIYYVVVFSTNFSWAMMILFASEHLKYSVAGFALVLAPLSANRLTLSLRKHNVQTTTPLVQLENRPVFRRRQSWVGTSTFDFSRAGVDEKQTFESCELTLLSDMTTPSNTPISQTYG